VTPSGAATRAGRAAVKQATGATRGAASHSPPGPEGARLAAWVVADAVPGPVAFIDTQKRYRMVNRAYEHYYQRPRSEMIGRTVRQVLGTKNWLRLRGYVARALAGESVRFESLIDTRKGTRSIAVQLLPVREAGRVLGYYVVSIDNTEWREAERELRTARQLFAGLMEAAPAVVYVTGLDGQVRAVNSEWERIVGVPRGGAVGRPLSAAFPPAAVRAFLEQNAEVARRRASTVLEDRGHYAGEERVYQTVKFPVFAEDGSVDAVGGISIDITHLKEVERALRSSRQRLAVLVERLPVGVIVWDLDFRVREWNPAAAAIFGYEPAEAMGMHGSRIVPAAAAGRVEAIWSALKEGAGGEYARNENIRKDGRTIRCEWFNAPLTDGDGRVVAVASMVRDVTLEQRAQAELSRYREDLEELVRERTAQLESSDERLRHAERLAALGTLAAGLGHDINNLVLPIRCAVEALGAAVEGITRGTDRAPATPAKPAQPPAAQAGSAPPAELAAREHLHSLNRAVGLLAQLAGGLLSLASVPDDQAGGRERTSLAAWWSRDGALLSAVVPESARLRVEIEPELPEVSLAAQHLSRAVLNLLTNAVEAAPHGAIRLWARRAARGEELSGSRATVLLGVSDEGPGMDQAVLRRAMEPFFTTKTRAFSTGLGLSVVDAIARAGGGNLGVESVPGRGTTVVLRLPAADREPERKLVRPASGRSVAVSVADDRLAGFLLLWLSARGFAPVSRAGEAPGSAEIWVTDAVDARLPRAAEHLAAGGGRRVVALGAPAALRAWAEAGAEPLDDPTDSARLAAVFDGPPGLV
jgi:PAS domain S-box-containing protein